jgi:hypothetical protein
VRRFQPEAILEAQLLMLALLNILNPANGAPITGTFSGYGFRSVLYDQRTFINSRA